jgi:hypothetical protein
VTVDRFPERNEPKRNEGGDAEHRPCNASTTRVVNRRTALIPSDACAV